jgi:hypothetical protein
MKRSAANANDADVAIYLDQSIGCAFGYFGDLFVNQRGMVFRSPWCFQPGTQLALRLCVQRSPACSAECQEVTGLIVHCEQLYSHSRLFESTILFLDIPEQLQEEIWRLANRPELQGNLN